MLHWLLLRRSSGLKFGNTCTILAPEVERSILALLEDCPKLAGSPPNEICAEASNVVEVARTEAIRVLLSRVPDSLI